MIRRINRKWRKKDVGNVYKIIIELSVNDLYHVITSDNHYTMNIKADTDIYRYIQMIREIIYIL